MPRVKLGPRTQVPLQRELLAEFLGSALLVVVVVGSGIAAQRLSPGDVGLQLLENSTATVLGLGVLILMFGPVSGAHLNPVVTAADWALSRAGSRGPRGATVISYVAAQTAGGFCGAVMANAMYDLPAVAISQHHRFTAATGLAEVVATMGLITLIFALARSGRGGLSAAAVGAYIGSAYWFTSSTSFANPAVTFGRMFSDTFAGIAPSSAPGFIVAQLVGALLGAGLVLALYPAVSPAAADVVVPHPADSLPERTQA
jgi:glycerol uptake facilitator-like aquaporin